MEYLDYSDKKQLQDNIYIIEAVYVRVWMYYFAGFFLTCTVVAMLTIDKK
jgi:hypothetical protein